MKKWRLYGIASLAIAASMLLAGCGNMPSGGTNGNNNYRPPFNNNTNNTTNNTNNNNNNNNNNNTNNNTTTGTTARFEKILNDAYTMPSSFDGWHLIVDDYDGDGRQEAFAFAGIPHGSYWENLSVVYLNSNGQITKMKFNSHMEGRPQNTVTTSDRSFSSSCIRYKSEKFVVFEWFDMSTANDFMLSTVYGVHNGNVTSKELSGGDVRKVPEGFICAEGIDVQYTYVVKDGRLVDMLGTSDAYKYTDPDYSLKTTPVKQAWKNYTQYTGMGNKEYFLQYDFDGDGRQEAYAIRGYSSDGTGYLSSAEIYYIGWGGTVVQIDNTSGQLYRVGNFGYTTDDSMIRAGDQRFALWQIPGAGHALTRLFGARNGVPYEPQISGNVSYFYQETSGRFFAESNVKYVDDEYLFNSATGQFYKK